MVAGAASVLPIWPYSVTVMARGGATMRYLAGLLFLMMLAVPGRAAAVPPTVPAVLERLAAVPDGFSGIVDLLRRSRPTDRLALDDQPWPDLNDQAEKEGFPALVTPTKDASWGTGKDC